MLPRISYTEKSTSYVYVLSDQNYLLATGQQLVLEVGCKDKEEK